MLVLRRSLLVRCLNTANLANRGRRQLSTAAIFPWRSSPTALERIANGKDDLSGQKQVFFERWIRGAAAARALHVEWFDIFANSWKEELAEDLGWAFQKGLAGLLSHTFSVPINQIDFDDKGIELDTSLLTNDKNDWTDEDSIAANDFCNATLDDSLRKQYSSIDLDKFDVKLRVQPTSHQIEFAYCLPLTRELVAKEPSLKETYREILQSDVPVHALSSSKLSELEEELLNKSRTSTVFIDVSIECLERFQVLDKTTGELVQGSEEDRSVMHLVRFEMQSDNETWKIVDWDDLLKGNIWH